MPRALDEESGPRVAAGGLAESRQMADMSGDGLQDIVRIRIAESLSAVVSQRLLPRKDGQGRVVACEIMVATPTIRDLILDSSRTGEIPDYVAAGRDQYGMQTFDQHLEELVNEDVVEFGVALAASTRPSDFQLKMEMR